MMRALLLAGALGALLLAAGCGGGGGPAPTNYGSGAPATLSTADVDRIIRAQLAIEAACGGHRAHPRLPVAVRQIATEYRHHPRGTYRPNPGDPLRTTRDVVTAEIAQLRRCGRPRQARRLAEATRRRRR